MLLKGIKGLVIPAHQYLFSGPRRVGDMNFNRLRLANAIKTSDPLLHARPVEIRLLFDDGTRETVVVRTLGTVES